MKKTAIAPSNIAFIKYWGKKDPILRIPFNGSISMNLSNLTTTTTVEFSEKYKKDYITVDGRTDRVIADRVIKHLDRIRKIAGLALYAKVVSQNNFPASTGLSSSACGFAALTVAATAAAGLKLSEQELSILARQASGSACRSIPDGIVEWIGGNSNETSYARSIFPVSYWNIIDVVVILSSKVKSVSTTKGQTLVSTSPFFKTRLKRIKEKTLKLKKLIKEKNFSEFGELVEEEALELHTIMLTSKPPLIYFYPDTIKLIEVVRDWRSRGLPVYFSLNTGHNIHLICEAKNKKNLVNKLKNLIPESQIIVNKPTKGSQVFERHLF